MRTHANQVQLCMIVFQATGSRRLKDTELVIPVVVGTVAFSLGKKVGADSCTLQKSAHILLSSYRHAAGFSLNLRLC